MGRVIKEINRYQISEHPTHTQEEKVAKKKTPVKKTSTLINCHNCMLSTKQNKEFSRDLMENVVRDSITEKVNYAVR